MYRRTDEGTVRRLVDKDGWINRQSFYKERH